MRGCWEIFSFKLIDWKTPGEALLTPTIIYVRHLMPLIKTGCAKALAHITGSGMPGNIPRVLPSNVKCVMDAMVWLVGLVQPNN